MYDADAEAAALEVPAFRYKGWRYKGRVLSEAEIAPFEPLRDPDLELTERIDLEFKLWRLTFAKRRWQFWKPDPVALIGQMPWDEYHRFRSAFFACLARRNAGPETAGTS